MKIGVLGSGEVGQRLGLGFARRGHDVMIASRSPEAEKLKGWSEAAGRRGRTGTFAQAAAHGDVVVLAVLGTAVDRVIDSVGPANFAGKVVIDVTNPLDFSKGMPPGLFVGTTDSLGERVQRKLPKAKVVKCLNIVPNSLMVDPKLPGERAEAILCGDDAKAKTDVAAILRDFGWAGTIDVGGIEAARWMEAMTALWVRVGVALNRWDHCFQVART